MGGGKTHVHICRIGQRAKCRAICQMALRHSRLNWSFIVGKVRDKKNKMQSVKLRKNGKFTLTGCMVLGMSRLINEIPAPAGISAVEMF